MEHSGWLGSFSLEEINDIIINGGVLFNFYDASIIVCSIFYIPASSKTLRKHGINYDVDLVGTCGPVLVHPNYVGNGLQKKMLDYLSNYCKSIGKKYIFTKVHPDNVYSIKNFLDDNYFFLHPYDYSHNGIRNVYIKDLN